MNDNTIDLETLQSRFLGALLETEASGHGLNGHINCGGDAQAARRIAIYRNAYEVRLIDALQDTFAHTLLYLGDAVFEQAARAFIAAHPSNHGNLRWYGSQFAPWLTAHFAADPDVGEMAELDYTLRWAFDGPDAKPLSMPELALIPAEAWETICFSLVPTAKCLTVRMNTVAIWHALDQSQPPPDAAPLSEPGSVLIWRYGLQPHFRSICKMEAMAIQFIQQSRSFSYLCSELEMQFPEISVPTVAGALLRRWIEDELLLIRQD
jgi:hypothetical protein